MTSSTEFALKPVLRIDFPPEQRLGRGKAQLLELIRDTGSISAAGRAMGMSYRRAWLLIDELNHMFSQPAVESQRGGKQGGGAVLTPFGEALVERFRGMEQRFAAACAEDLQWLERHRRVPGQAPE